MIVKDIDKYYTNDLHCEHCGSNLRFVEYQKMFNYKKQSFIAKRFHCDHCGTPMIVEPEPQEQIYTDGDVGLADMLEHLKEVQTHLGFLSDEVSRLPEKWKHVNEFLSFRVDFSDGIKAKIEIIEGYLMQHDI